METGPVVTDGAIDTTTVTIVVSALVSAVTGLAGLLYRRLLQENSELKAENDRLRTVLSGYEQAAPSLVAVIDRWMTALDSPDGSPSSAHVSQRRTRASSPLPRSRPHQGDRR